MLLQVLASRFTANRALDGWGGALNLQRHVSSPVSSLQIAHSYFMSNTASSGGVGGGVSVDSSVFSSTTILNTTFEGNSAGWGGGVDVRNCSSALQVRYCHTPLSVMCVDCVCNFFCR